MNGRMLRFILLTGVGLVLASCSSGPGAPSIGSMETSCTDSFCVDIPDGWETEVGENYISAHHELAPEDTFLTAGLINFEAIVVNAGASWPAPTDEVARAFWTLLEQVGVGDYERGQRVVGGAYRTWGTHETGTMWHLVYPTEASSGVGVELRAPNDSWESHADAVFASITSAP